MPFRRLELLLGKGAIVCLTNIFGQRALDALDLAKRVHRRRQHGFGRTKMPNQRSYSRRADAWNSEQLDERGKFGVIQGVLKIWCFLNFTKIDSGEKPRMEKIIEEKQQRTQRRRDAKIRKENPNTNCKVFNKR
jgi:hypothetical protein